ncbi:MULTISPECIES: protealysin inhibitor emfourin [Streptomyces]|uniref:protealysin inhibitor emfourin n=1 Tax=Streptomyces TaxID=1883 RepID=UPI0027E2CB25|nr:MULTISPECIES: protealysin inhibitor emfourin [Streptomyces]
MRRSKQLTLSHHHRIERRDHVEALGVGSLSVDYEGASIAEVQDLTLVGDVLTGLLPQPTYVARAAAFGHFAPMPSGEARARLSGAGEGLFRSRTPSPAERPTGRRSVQGGFVMLISVIRTGGFAGGERTASLDTQCRADGAELERLAERALSGEVPAGPDPVPDAFSYVLRVDGKLVELQEPYLTEDQRQLIDVVMAEAV